MRIRDWSSDVCSSDLAVPPLTHHLIGRPPTAGMTQNYARLCGSYAAARLLLTGGLGVHDYTREALDDPATLDLAARVPLAPETRKRVVEGKSVEVQVELGGSRISQKNKKEKKT